MRVSTKPLWTLELQALEWVNVTVLNEDYSSQRGRKTRGCGPETAFTVSWCDSSHNADRQCDPPREEATETLTATSEKSTSQQYHFNLLTLVFVLVFSPLSLSWICSVCQREATYLQHLVQPYRVRGGETDRTEEGGKWNCGTVQR